MTQAIAIAGTHSGVGKTSISIGLMRALSRRGLTVQSFKVGPDFIDPSHHWQATGRMGHNLDGWMLSAQTNLSLFQKYTANSDIAVVEGVMGLYDGFGPTTEAGSTAEMAKWLGIPVVLVVDARSMVRSAAAMVQGYANFDPEVNLVGVICNCVGSVGHGSLLREALERLPHVAFLGAIPRSDSVAIPERHLGLWMATEDDLGDMYIDALADLLEEHLDLDQLLSLSAMTSMPPPSPDDWMSSKLSHSQVRIGVARDNAFCFYYQENLELLENYGAELIEFSPLTDPLPKNLQGLYIGGGYPELYAEQLAANRSLVKSVRDFCYAGYPVYGECGGLMYLSQGIESLQGDRYSLVGIFPFWTRMSRKVKLGYAQVHTDSNNSQFGFPLDNCTIRGHRFHYSEILDGGGEVSTCYQVSGRGKSSVREGYKMKNTLASYVHLHFANNPEFAHSFVESCRQVANQQ
ncbi:cobyrinate a,c-diamide synthase [Geitlerinema sp. PCC 9228]|jgi:cobyrinic acid a,c-diamide synthase|uniref:cobyrinate a,c-diamide synthase n=1 Tax=Geitlerinema sp. PCC 9228 TaxID=111611 RepID=UPI0008F9E286|nr:cobyrinate a,c-diamide synthase [Geitlerinema sp. PCC 9228]